MNPPTNNPDDIKRPSSSGSLASIMWLLASICAVSDYIVAVVQTYVPMSQDTQTALLICEQFLSVVFLFETLVKWKDDFKIFWRSWLNVAYFGMVLALLVGRRVTDRYALTFVIVLRTTHIYRFLPFRDDLVKEARAMIKTLADHRMMYMSFIVFTLVYSVCGVHLLNTSLPSAFGSIPAALYTLSACMTQDGWGDIYQMFTEDMDADTFLVFLYFAIYVFLCIFMLQFIEYMLHQNLKKIMNPLADDDESKVVKDTNITRGHLKDGYPKDLTRKSYEELILIVAEMKKKAEESLQIKEELEKILEEISTYAETSEPSGPEASDTFLQSFTERLATEDILTALLDLDRAHASGTGEELELKI
ncbi:cation channel sperm-associated protein 4-like isoform X1 [Misgurnus anguillicaudatus]|uniref:cation channel sperm-associated protein 4-like isoform X1 n=2 Tax=Misgurnus anguillicaudatus TaxID=75329 RepID=UPI003CCF8BB6